MKLAKILFLAISALMLLPAYAYAANKNITITEGWNQISSPYVEPIEKNEFSEGCKGVIASSIKEYNSATDSYTDAQSLNYGRGYILYSTKACNFDPADNLTEYSKFNLTLQPGKHLIGAPYTALSANAFYNNCSTKNITEMNSTGGQKTATTLLPGKGYFVEVNSACDINSAENYDASISYTTAKIIQGDKGTAEIKVTNTGNRHIKGNSNITITASPFMHGISAISAGVLSKNTTKLNISESDTILLTFDIPADQQEGIYAGYITISHPNISKTTPAEIEILKRDKSITISPPQPISTMQGNTTSANFTITNNGNVNLTDISISINGLNESAIPTTISPSTIALLKKGETKNISLTLTPQKNAQTGTHTGNITARYAGTSKNETFTITIGEAKRALQVDFNPPALTQGENTTTTATLRNTGTIPLSMFEIVPYSLNCTECSPIEYLGITLNQTVIESLNTGESKQISAVLWPSRTQPLGNYSGNFIIAYGAQDREAKSISAKVTERKENLTISYTNTTTILKGGNTTAVFRITNAGNVNSGNTTITLSGFEKDGFTITPALNKTSTTLSPAQSETITYTASAPKTAPEGAYTGTITAMTLTKTYTAPITITVAEPEGSITIEHTASSAMEGEARAQSYITLSNTGGADLNIELNKTSPAKGSESITTQLETQQLQLLSGEKKNISITYLPENATKGTYTGAVTAKYQNKTTTAQLLFTVEGKNESIAVSASEIGWLKEFNTATEGMLNITNNGNTNLNITLSQSPIPGIGAITLSETQFPLAKGEKKTVRMIPGSINAGAGTYTGRINITYNGQQTQAQATLNVRNPTYGITPAPSQITVQGDIRGKNTTIPFTIKNSGDYDLSSIKLFLEIDKRYNATISPETAGYLGRGSEISGSINITIPHNEDTGSHKIGDIKLESDKTNLSIPIYANPDSALKIKELKAKVDGKSDTVTDGETISKKAEPGSAVKLELDIENMLNDKDISDVTVEATVNSIDDGDDIEEESQEKDINDGDNEKFTIEFAVPMLVDEKKYEIKIHVEGEDDDNVIHEADWTVYLNVEKETHNLIIDRAEISPSAISCSRSADAEVKIINLGTEDEDDVEVRVKNDELGINEQKTFSLDAGSDDSAENTATFSLDIPDDADEKTYAFAVSVYRNGALENTKTAELEVEKCERTPAKTTTTKQDDKKTGFVVEKNQAVQTQAPAQPVQTTNTLDEIRQSDWYLPALGVVVVALGATVIALIPK